MTWDYVDYIQAVIGTGAIVLMVSCGVEQHNQSEARKEAYINKHKCRHTSFAGREKQRVYTCDNGVYLREEL